MISIALRLSKKSCFVASYQFIYHLSYFDIACYQMIGMLLSYSCVTVYLSITLLFSHFTMGFFTWRNKKHLRLIAKSFKLKLVLKVSERARKREMNGKNVARLIVCWVSITAMGLAEMVWVVASEQACEQLFFLSICFALTFNIEKIFGRGHLIVSNSSRITFYWICTF